MLGETELTALSREHVEFPTRQPGQSDADYAAQLVKWACNHVVWTHPLRCRQAQLWNRVDRYRQAEQWLALSGTGQKDLMTVYVPSSGDDDDVPLPVIDELTPSLLNEEARLMRHDFAPSVRASADDPNVVAREGAEHATRALRQALLDMGLDTIKRRMVYHMVSYGGVWMRSRWVTTMENTVRVPVDGCSCCPQCSEKFAPGDDDDEQEEGGTPAVRPRPGEPCPSCKDHAVERPPTSAERAQRFAQLDQFDRAQPDRVQSLDAPVPDRAPGGPPLEPYAPEEGELEHADGFGRPFGMQVPLGQWVIEVLDPREVFEAEAGLDQHGRPEVRDVTLVRVHEIDAIRMEWPNARNDFIQVESERVLYMHHPLLGDWEAQQHQSYLRHHARVVERYRMPWMAPEVGSNGQPRMRTGPDGKPTPRWKLNKGKATVVCSDVVLQDADLMLETDHGPIPRQLWVYVPFDLATGGLERQGNGLAKPLLDAQDAINAAASAQIDERNWSMSRWLAERGTNLSFERSGRAAGIAWYTPDPNGGGNRPTLEQSTSVPRKHGDEIDWLTTYIPRRAGSTQPERGEAPSGVTAAQALQLLREESAEQRRPRIAGLVSALTRLYQHGLQLMQHYVREPRMAWDRNDSGEEFQRWWTGADFHGQTDVVIEVEGAGDSDALRNAKLKDAVEWGLVDATNPRSRRLIARLQGAPAELFAQDDLQEAAAEREFAALMSGRDQEGGVTQMGTVPVVDPTLDDHLAHAERHGRDFMGDSWRSLETEGRWDELLRIITPWQQVYAASGGPLGQFGLAAGITTIQDGILATWTQMLSFAGYPDEVLAQPVTAILLAGRAHREAHLWIASEQGQAQQVAPAPAAEAENPATPPPPAGTPS